MSDKYIYTEDENGNKVTLSKNGKVMGRPKNSRNKSKLIRAQLAFDDAAELAAETLVAIMENDTDKLNCTGDVPMTIRLNACKLILDKAIANEKDKIEGTKGDIEEDDDDTPIVSSVALTSV